ncbi:MAG: DNA internalization-related competence protein ComEC/Rec2 [Oscillospiraceae bacterium]|nr:DNA internalization-related competence protein ComEC/Rec2 [Oscillospiraceae bacterium]
MRKLMWLTVGFTGACVLGAYFYNPWLLPMAGACLLLAAISFLLIRWKCGFRIVTAICLGIALGLSFFNVFDLIVLQNARNMDGKTDTVTISVSDYSYRTDYGSAFDGKIELADRSYRVRVYVNTDKELQPGDLISGEFRFRANLFTDEDWLNYAGKGIYLTAYQNSEFQDSVDFQQSILHYPAIWRNALKEMIHSIFPEDTEGFARALLLGDTSGIDYETNTALKVGGIRHVIAVSGLHISIVFGFLYLLAGKKRLLTALIGIPAVILFAALSGFTPSVTRACIMQILMMLALLFDKEYDPPTALSFAVLVMLLANPMTVGSVSFQLSVACMVGIFLFGEGIYNRLISSHYLGRGKSKLSAWICGSVSITFSTMITTTPLTAYYFGTVSIIGVATNLLTLWAITIIFYGIMLLCALGCVFLPAAQFLGGLLAWLIRYVTGAAAVMSAVPMGAVYTKSIYIVLWLIFAYVLLAVYLLIKKKPVMLFAGLLVSGLISAVALSWVEPLADDCRVTMLDVGQGQAILLQSEGKNFLVDCGGDYDEGAADVTAETLLSQGIYTLDGVILTHYDGDHAGGARYLLTRVATENLFLPHAEDPDGVGETLRNMSGATVHTVKEDVIIRFGDAEITIFAPVSYKSGNESSMCVLFRTEKCDILITGDRSEQTERILLQRHQLPQLDVLVAGHHGAGNSTSEELLQATRPEYVFISVGEDNPYGHPAQQTIDRIADFGCKIFRTDENGTVIFRR